MAFYPRARCDLVLLSHRAQGRSPLDNKKTPELRVLLQGLLYHLIFVSTTMLSTLQRNLVRGASIMLVVGLVVLAGAHSASASTLLTQSDYSGSITIPGGFNDYNATSTDSGSPASVVVAFPPGTYSSIDISVFPPGQGGNFTNYCATDVGAMYPATTTAQSAFFSFPLVVHGSGCDITSGLSYPIYFNINGGASTTLYSDHTDSEPYFVVSSDSNPPLPPFPLPDLTTRIVDFTPEDGATTSNPVTFTLHDYINPADLVGGYSVIYTLHNIDQNVFLAGALSPSDIVLLDEQATTSGDFYFSTTTTIGEGNYRLEATLTTSDALFSFLGYNINYPTSNSDESHQFVVGSSTFLGNISQFSFGQQQALVSGLTATDTASLAGTCSPISTDISTAFLNTSFSVPSCLSFLLIPDSGQLSLMTSQGNTLLQHFPWGYAYRFMQILTASSSTSTLPSLIITLPSGYPLAGTSVNFTPWPYLLGPGSILASATTTDGTTFMQSFEPKWEIGVWTVFGFAIFFELIGALHFDGASSGAPEVGGISDDGEVSFVKPRDQRAFRSLRGRGQGRINRNNWKKR